MGREERGAEDRQATVSNGIRPSMTVIVSKGHGSKFHRPDGPGYLVACKTAFVEPAERMTAAAARERGYSPCRKVGCFDGTN